MRQRIMWAVAGAIVLTGCAGQSTRQAPVTIFPDMDYQGRYDPQTDRKFFADRRASRTPVPGTVARGLLKEDNVVFTGVQNGQYIGKNPLTIDEQLMKTGQRRFNTYCTPCHDATGQGRGVVAQRATWIPTSLQDPRVKQFNDGEIFHVITNGRRSMPAYKYQIIENDRWAIVAYVRALQRTTAATIEDVPADQRTSLK